jgi:hypothetical protein
VGVRHALFPRALTIWRSTSPVGCRRLSVSRRCAGLHGRVAGRSGPAAEPATAGVTLLCGLLGEASEPGVRRTCRHASARPGRDVVADEIIPHSGRCPQGRHRGLVATVVCLASRVLPLTPQVAFPSSACGRSPWSAPPANRILSPCRRCRQMSRRFRPDGLNP